MKREKVHLHISSRGEDAAIGPHLMVRAGISTCPFGECLIGQTDQGICHLSLFDPGCSAGPIRDFEAEWPGATFVWDHAHAAGNARRIFSHDCRGNWNLHVRGTPFQIRVWSALLAIPSGKIISYGALAEAVGKPKAFRATGSAVAKNVISILIPCHRVIRADGSRGHFRWGAERKTAIQNWENTRLTAD